MTRIAHPESKKSRLFRPALVPANHSEESRFGPLDGAVIAFFLLYVVALVAFLVVQGFGL